MPYKLSCHTTEPTKWHVRPLKTQISLGICPVWSVSLLCAQWVAKDPRLSSCGRRRLWSAWAISAQADLSLHWAHSHFVGFVLSRLKLATILINLINSNLIIVIAFIQTVKILYFLITLLSMFMILTYTPIFYESILNFDFFYFMIFSVFLSIKIHNAQWYLIEIKFTKCKSFARIKNSPALKLMNNCENKVFANISEFR